MLIILTPNGAHVPTFKENQYIVHVYSYLKRNILIVYWGRKQR